MNVTPVRQHPDTQRAYADVTERELIIFDATADLYPDRSPNEKASLRRTIEGLLDAIPEGHATRYDVAALTALLGILTARVPLLRTVLAGLVAEGLVELEPPEPGRDRTYLFVR